MKRTLKKITEEFDIEINIDDKTYNANVITSRLEIDDFERNFVTIKIDDFENLSDKLYILIENAIKLEFNKLDIFLNQ